MKTVYVVDSNPQKAASVFGADYGMYCDWCSQMCAFNSRRQVVRQLMPVPFNVYRRLCV